METNGERNSNRSTRRSLVLLLLILLVAGTARYYHLGQIPHGLFMDEAADGNDAARSLQDHDYRVFYKADAGREGLWIVMMAASIAHYGHTVYAVRCWAPLTGLLTVLALYGLAARWFGTRVALISAWLLGTSFWHLVFSRIAFRGILVPLFLVASIYFLQVAWASRAGKAAIFALLGGFCFGLGFYSYIAFRIAPVLLAIIMGLEFASSEHDRRVHLVRVTGIWVVVAIATVTPLVLYFIHNPADFFTRASQVSIWRAAHPVRLMFTNVVRTAWMFIGKGDQNWRHNLRPYPELLYPIGIFFLIGTVLVLLRRAGTDRRRSPASYVLIWLGVMAIPAILTREGVPHALRSIGTLPAAILLAALGADWLLTRWRNRRLLLGLVVAILVASGGMDFYRYFLVWARKPQVQQAFQLPLLNAAEALRDTPPTMPVLVIVEEPSDYDWEPVAFDYHEDDLTVRLPLQANIPLFIAAGRANTMYLPSSATAHFDTKKWYGCDPSPSLSSVPENRPTYIPGCDSKLMVLHLSK